MNAEEIMADESGSNIPPPKPRPVAEGEWGFLKDEPCRFCLETGGVFFMIDDGPEGISGNQSCRCDKCKRTWMA